jgi:hypothetical protein
VVEQVDDFLVAAVLDQVIDVVAEVGEASFEAFDVRENRFVGGNSFEALGVVRHIDG